MESDISQLLDSQRINSSEAEKLKKLAPQTVCVHRSWGVGIIKKWDTLQGTLTIDFKSKEDHPMEFSYAAQSLVGLDDDHIVARIVKQKDATGQLSLEDKNSFMKLVVRSLGKDATPEKIERTLVPDLVSPEHWKKWWDSAKKEIKKDPHFSVPTKRTQPIILHEDAQDHEATSLESFKNAVGPKAQILALDNIIKHLKDISGEEIHSVIAEVNESLAKIPKTQQATAIELALARDELISLANIENPPTEPSFGAFLPTSPTALNNVIQSLPTGKQARCLEYAREFFGDKWADVYLSIIPDSNGRLFDEIYTAFQKENRQAECLGIIEKLARERKINFELLMWICKNRKGGIETIVGSQLFYWILSVLEMDQLSGTRKFGRLEDLVLNDKNLLQEIFDKARDEEIREMTRAIMFSSLFEDRDKRSLLGSVVKICREKAKKENDDSLYTQIESMVAGETKRAETNARIVSWESLERRRAELEELVNKRIPENRRDLEIARSYGDLRENHEYKSAKEMKAQLEKRQAELEFELSVAQGTDFADADTSEISIGTRSTLKDDSGKIEIYTILGAWDSHPEKGIISYMTPRAKIMLGTKTGQQIELNTEDGKTKKYTVEKIEKHKN